MVKNIKKSVKKVVAQAKDQIVGEEKIEFLSWEGKMGRGKFWKAYFILMIISFLAYTFAPFIRPVYYSWILYSISIFTGILVIFQVVKRLRGGGNSPWICLMLFIPLVNLYVLYLLFVKK